MILRFLQNFDPLSVNNLSDLKCEEQIALLPVRQLKVILQRNCINYRGCVEKEELRMRVKRLWEAKEKDRIMEKEISGRGDYGKASLMCCRHGYQYCCHGGVVAIATKQFNCVTSGCLNQTCVLNRGSVREAGVWSIT